MDVVSYMGYPMQSDAEKLYRRIAFLKLGKDSQQRFRRDGFLGLFGRKVDLLDHYEKKLEDLQDNVRMEQSSLTGKVCAICVSIGTFLLGFKLNENGHINKRVFPLLICLKKFWSLI